MSWIERAKVGDKVVCVKEGDWDCLNGDDMSGPKFGDICTISEIGTHTEIIWLTLSEWSDHMEFAADSFKPAHDTTHQVELLKRICLNTPETVS